MDSVLFAALQQALLFMPLTLGIYLSYRILAVTDLTVDGSFVLGAATYARLISTGYPEPTAIAIALAAGAIAGIFVSVMQRTAHINSLIASILAVFMLHSVNFQVMGRPNISLLDSQSWIGTLQINHELWLWLAIAGLILVIVVMLRLLLHSRLGLLLRAYGDNPPLLTNMGKSTLLYLCIGLALSNTLAALCGILTAQVNGYADINMGLGMALTAIGAVVIGQQMVSNTFFRHAKFNVFIDCFACLVGCYLYFLVMNVFLLLGINPIHLKFLLGLVLIIFLGLSHYTSGAHYEHQTFDNR